MTNDFRPTLYVNHACPFCLKLVLYLDQAGLLDHLTLDVLEPGSPHHSEVKEKLASHFDSVSFPTVEIEPDRFMSDSDAIIAHYEKTSSAKSVDMPVLDYYASGVMKKYIELFVENRNLKKSA